MKLRNKKTGEINLGDLHLDNFDSLAELNEKWEDYEEPKEEWYINCTGEVLVNNKAYCNMITPEKLQSIGNYFETKEEAEKAVEKLKAWKRLKEANIDYKLTYEYDDFTETMHANVSFSFNSYPLVGKDLELLFGGE